MGLSIAEGITDKLGYIGKPHGRLFVAAGLKGGCKTSAGNRRAADRMASRCRWI
jgi:hypothetical protein